MVVHSFNPSMEEGMQERGTQRQSGRSLSLRPAWSTEKFTTAKPTKRTLSLKTKRKKKTMKKKKVEGLRSFLMVN